MDGTEQIALNNLDFTMQYESRDEFGALCGSFENMKDQLQQNFKIVWRMTEERRKLNAAFAHDLRTPLTVLRGYTDFLDEYIPFPGKSDEKLLATNRMMAQYIHRLEEYTEIMNTIQKLEDTPVKTQFFSMDDFMELLKDNVKLTAEEYKKEFQVVNKTMRSSIHADISLIVRTFENIVRNAFRFAKIKVTICLFCRNEMLYIEVTDDG